MRKKLGQVGSATGAGPFFAAAGLFALLSATGQGNALAVSIPNKMVYQGHLTGAAGTPIAAGTYNMKFELFSSASGGTALASFTILGIYVNSNGNFRAEIGDSKTDLQALLRDNQDLYLEISIQAGSAAMETLSPRIKVGATARAHHSQYAENGVPVGTVLPFAGSTAPSGWMLCDGSQVNRTTYADLFKVVGTIHGSGDGSTTFHLPDYRGRFLRGVDNGAGNDPDAASRTAMNTGGNTGDMVGTLQGNSLQSHKHTDSGHTHTYSTHSHTSSYCWSPAAIAVITSATYSTGTSGTGYASLSDPVTSTGGTVSHGKETRPANAAVNYIIKY